MILALITLGVVCSLHKEKQDKTNAQKFVKEFGICKVIYVYSDRTGVQPAAPIGCFAVVENESKQRYTIRQSNLVPGDKGRLEACGLCLIFKKE